VEFVRDNPGEPVPEETFTHPHSSWSSIIRICFLHLLQSMHPPYSIHVLYSLFPPSLSKFSLVYLLVWYPPLHTPYISSPNHCLLFAAHANTIATCFAVVLRLCHLILGSLSTLYLELLSCNFTPHIHLTRLCPLKCHLIFLCYRPGLTTMQHTTSYTTAVQSDTKDCSRSYARLTINNERPSLT